MSDLVGVGLFAGSAASVFIVLGGLVFFVARNPSDGDFVFKYFTGGNGLFWWLILLTALVVGLLIYVIILNEHFNQLPRQTGTATVS
jgi:uncharacterized integral membrane protein